MDRSMRIFRTADVIFGPSPAAEKLRSVPHPCVSISNYIIEARGLAAIALILLAAAGVTLSLTSRAIAASDSKDAKSPFAPTVVNPTLPPHPAPPGLARIP